MIANQKYKLLQSTQQLSFLNRDDEFSSIYEKTIASQKVFYTTS